MAILIPHEHSDSVAPKTQQFLGNDQDQRILKDTSIKIERYLKNGGNMGLNELKNLLHGMERSVIVVQRRKKKLVEKRSRRRV